MDINKTVKVEVGDKVYTAYIAESEEDKIQGLSNVLELSSDEALLFDYSDDLRNSLEFNTLEMEFPIDIVFVNDDDEVVAVEYGEPKSEEVIECIADEGEKIKYVLEVNANSGIKVGDDVDVEDDDETIDNKMYILGPDGEVQMDLAGGERIISRLETRQLIKKAKKANKEKTDSAYKKLGIYMFKVLAKQNSNKPEYTSLPK